MNCAEYQEMISVQMGGELDDARAADLACHLDDCDACRAEETAYRFVEEAAAEAYAPPEVDEVAWERVWQGVGRAMVADERPRAPRRRIGWAVAAAAAVVAAVSLTLLMRREPPPEPDRLAMLRDGGASIEMVQGGTADYFPMVTTAEGDVPVIYVYEVGQ